MKRLRGLVDRRLPESDDGRVGVILRKMRASWCAGLIVNAFILKRAGAGWRMSKHTAEGLAALDVRFAPHKLLHPLGTRNPRASGFAPAGRARNRHLHVELVADLDCVSEGIFPFRRHVGQTLLYHLRSLKGSVEVLKTGKADAVHPLQIKLDAFLSDVSIHPMPPHTWPGRHRRILEAFL